MGQWNIIQIDEIHSPRGRRLKEVQGFELVNVRSNELKLSGCYVTREAIGVGYSCLQTQPRGRQAENFD